MNDPLIFSTAAYDYLRRDIATIGGYAQGVIESRHFPDGERYDRIETEVDQRDVVLIGGTISDSNTLELYDLACAIVKYGARSITMIIPFFGYSTMERAVHAGEVVKAKSRARLFSSVPGADAGNRVFLVDIHSEGLPYYFEGGIRPLHVYAKPVIRRAARSLAGDDFILACTDAGRAKWVESLANDLGVRAAFIFKRRLSGTETEVMAVSAQVEGMNVVIYDDMIRTGGSLISAARAYKDAGAGRIWAIATHGVFPQDALVRIEDAGLFEAVVTTDSHPRARALAGGLLSVESLAALLVDKIREPSQPNPKEDTP